jgi:predicted nucleotide-binding protein (sugar kinase/HSP70/actin superfamily)
LGRPYNLLDSYMNLGLFERLRRLDVLGIPQSLFPGLDRPEEERSTLPWRLPADMHDAAVALSKVEGVSPVVISCFGCGPDAFTLRRIDAALSGKPHLVLEFDEHRGEAGLVTRLEAFIDQLEGTQSQRPSRLEAVVPSVAFIPEEPARVRIPYFADLAFAFSGLFRVKGHDAKVLPLPGPEVKALGERYSLGKECHAYSMIVGDLLDLAKERTEETPVPETVFYFPGTSIPCLLYEYGSGMQGLLRELHIEGIRVSSPTGRQLINAFGIEAMDRFYVGVLAIEILAKAVCEIRPYEMERGETDEIHRANLRRIEESIAKGNVLEALRESLGRLGEIEVEELRDRPTVGIAGDIYTKVNPAANADLVRWLEDRGLEVWPSPFQIDLIDLSISRSLYRSVESLDLPGFLLHGSVALRRAVDLWQVRVVVGSRVSRLEEPGYLELKRLAAPYMPNEAHDLLYTNVAKIVDFARNGADGIVNAICFGCMVGNASAAVIERIRRDYDDIPIITAVYSGASDPSRNMVLEAFASQVIARHRRRKAAQGALLAKRLLARTRGGRWTWPFAAP